MSASANNDLLDDSAYLAAEVDGHNIAGEQLGQGRSIVIQRFNLKKVILTWGSLVGTILGGAVFLGYHYSEMCGQLDANTKKMAEAHQVHEKVHVQVEANREAIGKHHVVLERVETAQKINANNNERRFDRTQTVLDRIAEQVGATNQ